MPTKLTPTERGDLFQRAMAVVHHDETTQESYIRRLAFLKAMFEPGEKRTLWMLVNLELGLPIYYGLDCSQ